MSPLEWRSCENASIAKRRSCENESPLRKELIIKKMFNVKNYEYVIIIDRLKIIEFRQCIGHIYLIRYICHICFCYFVFDPFGIGYKLLCGSKYEHAKIITIFVVPNVF